MNDVLVIMTVVLSISSTFVAKDSIKSLGDFKEQVCQEIVLEECK